MKKKKLYLHIGTHKTGSTTIQSILKQEKINLEAEGIFYLGRFRDISKPMKGMTEYDEVHVKKFRAEVIQLIEKNSEYGFHTYITSNEKWSGHDMLAYDNAPVNAKMLYNIFQPFDFDIKVIVYLRRQDKFFESAYAQKIKRGGTFSFSEYLEKVNDIKGLHWDSYLDSYAQFFGKENIIVQRFDRKHLPEKNSLIQNFGCIVNSDHLKNFNTDTVKNKGYSKDVMEFARLSNEYLTNDEARTLKYMLIDANLPKGNYSYFSLENRKNLLANYEESNRNVALKYLNGTDKLFPTNDLEQNNSKQSNEGLSPESLAVILSKVILVQNQKLSSKIEENREMLFHKRVNRKLSRIRKRISSIFR